ncbi:hypothetical protein [Desulfothermobacter acidiphilus]|uniref:hypothetical protein n=1 Tax=Desulfothermobacter acidiphilus TaxID=1938353 RepID=UPI003F899AF3
MPDVLRIIKVELLRVMHKPFFYVVPLVALLVVIPGMMRAYKLAVALHNKTLPLPPWVPPPPGWGADLTTLLHWFRWENLPTVAGASLLAGWGVGLFIYAGAAWFGDDLSTGVIKQVAVLRERLMTVILGKALALALYVTAVLTLTVLGAVIATLFLPDVPGREIGALFSATNVQSMAVYTGIALMWAFFAAAITVATNSALLGAVTGILWFTVETVTLVSGNGPLQLFAAKVAPGSTCQSLLASVYDRFSWVGQPHLWVTWVTAPPLTRTFEDGIMKPYLLPFTFLLTMLGFYLLAAVIVVLRGYCWRASK